VETREAKKETKTTDYIILSGSEKGWQKLTGVYEGVSGRAAILAALNSGNAVGDQSGEYVAVPMRSWQPVKVKRETKLTFK
jgi:hypothetical protein